MKKIVFSWIVCVLGLVALLAVLGQHLVPETSSESGKSLVSGAFTLQNGKGKTVTEKDFSGRYMLVYFGYTHCPDVCPTALLLMENAINQAKPLAGKIQPIFISIDPARDTPKIASDYADHFGGDMVGLSGTAAQVKQAAENYKVYYRKVDDKGSALGYVMDHSGFIYLMGPDASYITHFPHNVSERELEDGLRKYVR